MKTSPPSVACAVVLALFLPNAGAQVTNIQTNTNLMPSVIVRAHPSNPFVEDVQDVKAMDFTSFNRSVSVHAEQDGLEADALARQNILVNAGTFDLLVSASGEASVRPQQPGNPAPGVVSGGGVLTFFSLGFTLVQRSRFSINGSVSAAGPNPPLGGDRVDATFNMGGNGIAPVHADTRERSGTVRTIGFSKSGILEPGAYGLGAFCSLGGGSFIRASYNYVLQIAPAPNAASEVIWRSAANGDFSDATHWDPQTAPDGADNALFTRPGTYTVNVGTAASDRAVINRSRVTFANANYTLGAISPLDPSLTVENGGRLTLDSGTLRAVHASIGSDFTSSGASHFTVLNPGTQFVTSGAVNIGGIGSGGLFSVLTGATATTATAILGGLEPSVARVDGAGTSWNTGNLQIRGKGSQLFVFRGGRLTSGDVVVQAVDRPQLRVQDVGSNGESSRWDMQKFANDDAELLIKDGGHVTARSILLGQLPYRTGSVIVSGVNQPQNRPSQLDVATSITVGGLGKGKLLIEDGGFVSALGDVAIGGLPDFLENNPGRGDVVVDGRNSTTSKFSTLQIEGKLQVGTGVNGVGQLVISNGGRVECASAQVGVANGSGGAVVLASTEAGLSRLNVQGDLTIGLAGSTGVVALTDSTVLVGGNINVSSSGFITGTGQIEAGGTITVNPGGILSPGLSPGILTIKGNLVLEAGAVIQSEVAGPAAGKQADQLIVTGDVTLNGTLKLQFINGYAPKAGDQFQFFKVSGTTTGDFSSIEAGGLEPGAQFQTALGNGVYTATALNNATPLPAVSIRAVPKKAPEKGGRKVALLVSRTGSKASKASPLTVNYTIGGSAENGIDYTLLTGSVTIPAGKNAVPIKFKLIDDAEFEGVETIEFTVIPGVTYARSLRSKAQVTILDNKRSGH